MFETLMDPSYDIKWLTDWTTEGRMATPTTWRRRRSRSRRRKGGEVRHGREEEVVVMVVVVGVVAASPCMPYNSPASAFHASLVLSSRSLALARPSTSSFPVGIFVTIPPT